MINSDLIGLIITDAVYKMQIIGNLLSKNLVSVNFTKSKNVMPATTQQPTTIKTIARPNIKGIPLLNDCGEVFDYLSVLENGMDQREMDLKIPCTIISNREAAWEHQHFHRGYL